jgi:hypothetical protein
MLHCSLAPYFLQKLYLATAPPLRSRISPQLIDHRAPPAVCFGSRPGDALELTMFEALAAKIVLILPFILAACLMLWILWNLNKQGKRDR